MTQRAERPPIKDADAPFIHFLPESGRDRFGNRAFTSPGLAYLDRSGKLNKAALLVSPQGQDLLKTDSNFLNLLDVAISATKASDDPLNYDDYFTVRYRNKQQYQIDKYVLDESYQNYVLQKTTGKHLSGGNEMTIKRIAQGGQSSVFAIHYKKNVFVLKIRSPQNEGSPDPSQPYINEMLQTQSLTADIPKLKEIGVDLPEFLLASGSISLVKFVPGRQPKDDELVGDKRVKDAEHLIEQYIAERYTTPLWKNIRTDAHYHEIVSSVDQVKTNNFVLQENGRLVFIDPLYYHEPEDEYQERVMKYLRSLEGE